MHKTLERTITGVLSYLSDCIGTLISFTGSARLSPLYLKLAKISVELQNWRNQSRKTSAPVEHEGLGAVYDKREWVESYYGKRPLRRWFLLTVSDSVFRKTLLWGVWLPTSQSNGPLLTHNFKRRYSQIPL